MTVEMVIILKSTWAASHGKRSAHAVRDAGAHANLQRNFSLSPSVHRTPSFSHYFFCVCECATKKCTKARRMFNCLWNLNGEITQLLKRHVCAGSFVLFCSLTITFFCLTPRPLFLSCLSFVLSRSFVCFCFIFCFFLSNFCLLFSYSWWFAERLRMTRRCYTVKQSKPLVPTRLWSCSGWRVFRRRD